MQAQDFTAESPGRLVPTTDKALAFVPAPLPHDLPLSGATARCLSEADYALGRLAGAAGRLVNPYLIGQPLLRREAILSSRIEGTFTTPEQLVLMELGIEVRPANSRQTEDTREVLNYVQALDLGFRRLREIPLSLRLVRELHGALRQGVRGGTDRPGDFRDVQNYIGSAGDGIARPRYVPPPVAEMRDALNRWEEDLHREDWELPLLVQLALSHYQFEAIHPFRDGNGRVGRLLIPLSLHAHGRLDEPLLYMSAYFDAHRREYVDLLRRVSTHGDWNAWVTFFLRGVAACCEESLILVEQLIALRDRYHDAARRQRAAGSLAMLIDHLFHVPSITIGFAGTLLGVTPAAASANLRKLQELGVIVEVTGRKRDQVFVAREILAFVGRDTHAPNAEGDKS